MGIAASLTVLALAWPTPVSGTEAGMRVARQTWGMPACGQPHVEVSTPTNYQAAHDSGYFDSEPLAWADPTRCVIVLNPHWKIHTAVKRCHAIVHEWGHLAGRDHSENQRSVMYGGDLVTEGFERSERKWYAFGAFRPCYAATNSS